MLAVAVYSYCCVLADSGVGEWWEEEEEVLQFPGEAAGGSCCCCYCGCGCPP